MSTYTALATDRFIKVSTNGTQSVVLYDPTKIPGERVVVKNDTTQAGTTTISTAAGDIDGSSTVALTGANLYAELQSDGTNYKVIGGSATLAGAVPTARSLATTAPLRIDGGASADLSANRTLSVNDATTGAVGVIQLAGDLNGDGTAAATPTIGKLTGLSGAVTVGVAVALVWANNAQIKAGTSSEILLDAGTHSFRSVAGTYRGTWRSTGLRVGDASAAVEGFEVLGTSKFEDEVKLADARLTFQSNVSFPAISHVAVTGNLDGKSMTMTAQSAGSGSTNKSGGSVFVSGGAASGAGVHGSVVIQTNATSTTLANFGVAGLRLGDGTAATEAFEIASSLKIKTSGDINWISSNGSLTVPTASSELLLNADVLSIRDRTGSYRGTWRAAGLRIGDSGTATHILEIAGSEVIHEGSFFTFKGTVTSPLISQAAASSANGQPFNITAQAGNGSDKDGGPVYISGGAKTGAGADGLVRMYSGSTAVTDFTSTGVDLYQTFLTFKGNVTSPLISQAVASSANGQPMNITAQAGNGTDKNGGPIYLTGGAATGAGVPGSVRLITGDGAGAIYVESAVLTNELRHVVALARNGGISATQMPSNTGNFVIYIANADTVPTANSVGGGILYCDAGALKYRGTSGTVTPLGAA